MTIAEAAGVDPTSFVYRKTTSALSGIESDIRPSQAVGQHEAVEHGWRKSAKVARPGEPVDLLISRSPVLAHLSQHRWATRRILFREPLELYQPRRPSEELRRLAAQFDAVEPDED